MIYHTPKTNGAKCLSFENVYHINFDKHQLAPLALFTYRNSETSELQSFFMLHSVGTSIREFLATNTIKKAEVARDIVNRHRCHHLYLATALLAQRITA